MAGTLTHRITMLCGSELATFRSQLAALAREDMYSSGLESAVTALQRRPALLTEGSSVTIVGFGTKPAAGPPVLTLSVSLLLDYQRWPLDVFWDEAHAWADAVAAPALVVAGISARHEDENGMVFHYRLKAASSAVPKLVRSSGT